MPTKRKHNPNTEEVIRSKNTKKERTENSIDNYSHKPHEKSRGESLTLDQWISVNHGSQLL